MHCFILINKIFFDNLEVFTSVLLQGLLREIKDAGLKPTLATFNDVMSCIAMRSKWTESKDWIMMVINEMREIGIGEVRG